MRISLRLIAKILNRCLRSSTEQGGQFLRHRFGDIFWKRAFDAVQQVVEVRATSSREFQPKCNVSAID